MVTIPFGRGVTNIIQVDGGKMSIYILAFSLCEWIVTRSGIPVQTYRLTETLSPAQLASS